MEHSYRRQKVKHYAKEKEQCRDERSDETAKMNGTMLIISPGGSIKTSPLTAAPDLERLQEELGGYLEQVSRFDTIMYHDKLRPCVAFCDEEGKLKGKKANIRATQMWTVALGRHGIPSPHDVLCGNVVIIFGDRELMDAL